MVLGCRVGLPRDRPDFLPGSGASLHCSLQPRPEMNSENPTPPVSPGTAIAEALDRLVSAAAEVSHALKALAELQRSLTIEDPHSHWHAIVERAIVDVYAMLLRASCPRPVGTGSVARAAGVATHTVVGACASGDLPSDRSDSGEYLIAPEDARAWANHR